MFLPLAEIGIPVTVASGSKFSRLAAVPRTFYPDCINVEQIDEKLY
jgi:hypothetical protein